MKVKACAFPSPMLSTTKRLRTFVVLCFIALTQLAGNVSARDLGSVDSPLVLAQRFFAQADRCEPQVRLINQPRVAVIAQLLPESVTYNELGTRVVYSVFHGAQPLGLLHVRHETGQWGLVKIAWALNTDFTINNFAILRSREPGVSELEAPAFRISVIGQSSQAIAAHFSKTETVDRDASDNSPGALTRTVLGSALKCLVATQVGWELTTLKLRITQAGHVRFPEAASLRFAPGVRSSRARLSLEQDGLGPIDPAWHRGLILAQALDGRGRIIGSIVHANLLNGPEQKPLLFTVIDGRLIATEILHANPSETLAADLVRLHGRSLTELAKLTTPLAKVAAITIAASTYEEESPDGL